MKLASFDIFDTCLIRSCGQPQNLFDVIGAKLFGNDSQKIRDFANLRRQAENSARKLSSSAEITLMDIYAQIDSNGLNLPEPHVIAELEQETERENLIGVDNMRQRISAYRDKGYQIAFISDMYLDSAFLKSVLKREGMMLDDDFLFVSSEIQCTKADGSLYDYVNGHLGANNKLESWIHFGDNPNSDYRNAKARGIKPSKVVHGYTRAEQTIAENKNVFDFGHGRKLASISRAARLSFTELPGIRFAADYVAPLYVPFVFKVLKKARESGITDLYFVARDGCILYEIAQSLKVKFPEIGLHYLYLSRSSLYFPALDSADDIDTIINWKFSEKLRPDAVIKNYTGLDISDKINLTGLNLKDILKNEDVRQILRSYHATERKKLLQYFKETGLATKTNKNAIVDLRGTGKTQRMINNVLAKEEYARVKAFYLELGMSRKPQDPDSSYYSIINNERYHGTDRQILEAAMILESFYSVANHPRTIGYRENDNTGQIEPVFEEEPNLIQNISIFNTNLKVLRQWSLFYLTTRAYLNNDYNLQTGLSLLKKLLFEPEYYALALMSKIIVSETGVEKSYMVQKLTPLHILRGRPRNLSWYIGSFSYTFGRFGTYALRMLRQLSAMRSKFLS